MIIARRVSVVINEIVKSNIESEIKESPIISEIEYETPQESNTIMQRKKLMKESEKIAQRRAEMIAIRDMQSTKLVITLMNHREDILIQRQN